MGIPGETVPEEEAPAGTIRLRIRNEKGLHARAAARLAGVAGDFDATVIVRRNAQEAVAGSIMGLMLLGAGPGAEIRVTATGPQAREALEAIRSLVEGRFGEMK